MLGSRYNNMGKEFRSAPREKPSSNTVLLVGRFVGLVILILCGSGGGQDQVPSEAKFTFVRAWTGKEGNQTPLRNPSGICIDSEDIVYVADTGNHRIAVFDTAGRLSREMGGLGVGAYQLNRPSDITAKSGLDLLVADTGNDRIQRFNRRLGYISTVRSSDAFTEPISVDVSTFGDFFILDGSRKQIVKIDALGSPLLVFGGIESGDGELDDPKDVSVWSQESIWVADGVSGNVVQFDLFGNFLARYHLGDGIDVRGVAADADGVWIAAHDRVGFLSYRGKVDWYFGQDHLRKMSLVAADDVAVSQDQLVLLDATNGAVAWFRLKK